MKVKFIGSDGGMTEANLSANIYKASHDAGQTLDAYLASQYKTDESKHGSVLSQMMASAGLFTHDDPSLGVRSAKIGAAFDGVCDSQWNVQGGSNVADAIPASRILFPAALLKTVEDKLYADRNSEIAMFDSMVATKETVAGSRYEYAVLNYDRPERARSSRIGQLSEPNLMMTLTTGEKQGYIPTYSIGVQISDQAMKSQTLDFLSLSLARQAEVEAAERMDECMLAMINGDVDEGITALVAEKAVTYDVAITTANTITQKAWLKWLAKNRRVRSINVTWMTIDTFLAVEQRTGKPIEQTDNTKMPFNQRPDIIPSLMNLDIGGVRVFIVEDTVVPDYSIIGMDTRYAMRKVTNSEAQYQAAEQLVLRRAQNMRWDWGYTAHRLFDEAWGRLDMAL